MATTFADRLQEGIGVAEKLAGNAIEALGIVAFSWAFR